MNNNNDDERDLKGPPDVETLHKESNYYQFSPKNMSLENIMIEDYENEAHIAAYPESIASSDSDESSTFEMSEENLFMCLSQAIKTVIPRPVNPKEYFRPFASKEMSVPRSLVIIIRDIAECNNNTLSLAKTIQERLSKMTVRSYVLTVSSILKDLQAVKLTREHAIRIASENDKDLLEGYTRLILAIIANKMKNKTQRVIIIDIGDEVAVRLYPVRDFCMRLRAEIFALDSFPEEQFESSLSKVVNEVSKRYKEMDWTTPVPICDDEENIQDSNAFMDPGYLLSLQHKTSFKFKRPDSGHSKSAGAEQERSSESSIEKTMEASDSDQASVPDEGISGHKLDSNESISQRSQISLQNNSKSSANKIKRRKKRRPVDEKLRSANSAGFKSKASTSTASTLNDHVYSTPTANNNTGIDNNNSENSRMDEIMSPKLNLLVIQKVPDEYPSRLSSRLIGKSLSKEDGTYKGWVAVENGNPDRSSRYIAHKFRSRTKIKSDMKVPKNSKDGLFKRLFRPIRLFITCQYCNKSSRKSHLRVSPEERLGYKGISLDNAHPF